MGGSVKAVLGSAAVCGVLLLAGCGGTSSAETGWNPPRPGGISDDDWALLVDPASLPVEELAGGYCQAVKPTPTEVDADVQMNPEASVQEVTAFYDYVFTYVGPLCADLPPSTGNMKGNLGQASSAAGASASGQSTMVTRVVMAPPPPPPPSPKRK